MTALLDRPVWHALATRHAGLAAGDGPARRYRPGILPFAATADDGAASLAALARLVGPGDRLILLMASPAVLPEQAEAELTAAGVQMVAETLPPADPDPRVVRLGPADAGEMLALASLTRPGPFSLRSQALGDFFGIREDGILVAMAGERMKLDGHTEVSGICTRPGHRGRGLARVLARHVAAAILARGEQPFLHAYADNAAAIRLYESLGFVRRCAMHVAVIRRRAAAAA